MGGRARLPRGTGKGRGGMFTGLKIKKLFGKFDYDIKINRGGVTIITGPNGYGKTTIFKILDALETYNLAIFFAVPFESIHIMDNSNLIMAIHRESAKEIIFSLKNGTEKLSVPNENKSWYFDTFFIQESISMPKIFFIKDQRLYRHIMDFDKATKLQGPEDGPNWFMKGIIAQKNAKDEFIPSVEYCSKQLSSYLKNAIASSTIISQQIDSSFPERLFDETNTIDEIEYNERYRNIMIVQKQLSKYGLSSVEEEKHASYRKENSKALLVYIKNAEEKMRVYGTILEKLNIFSEIIEKRMFVNKHFKISPEFGIRFITDDGDVLSLKDLSSGEQHEIILFYNLIFEGDENTLVLIDEPEMSLHIVWQKEFIDDLLTIVDLRKITIIVATHSPFIINAHGDLVVDLYENSKE